MSKEYEVSDGFHRKTAWSCKDAEIEKRKLDSYNNESGAMGTRPGTSARITRKRR